MCSSDLELRADGFTPAEIEEAVAYRKLYFDFLQTGAHRDQLEAADQNAKGARWYPRFGGMISRDAPLAIWWQRNASYVPTDFWKRVHVPTLPTLGDSDDHLNRTPKLHSGSGTRRRRRIDSNAGGELCVRPNQPTKRSQNDAVSSKAHVTRPEVY